MNRLNLGLAICLLTTCVASSSTDAAVVTGPIVNPANGNSYYLLENDTWTNSQAEAVTLSGNLVTINDAAENQWVFDTFGDFGGVQRNLWIGYNDEAVDGTFVWVSGETPGYTNWNPGEPNASNDGPGGEDYAVITAPAFSGSGVWNDTEDTLLGRHELGGIEYPNFGVVEIAVPEPSSLVLFSVVGLSCLVRRRSRVW